jgi:sporulation-control protein
MVFGRIRSLFGGGTTIDTIVHTAVAEPGGALQGVIEVVGGSDEQEIKYIALNLVCRVEVETDDGEHHSDDSFAKQHVHGAFTLQPGQRLSIPFTFGIPLQTPFNVIDGQDLPGVRLGVRTELEIARSFDKGDYDPIRVGPLPAQRRILTALERLGCQFRRTDVERGHIRGADFGFYQELEFSAPHALSGRINELEVTFLARPHELEVVLEADKKGGFFTEGQDKVRRLVMDYNMIMNDNVEAIMEQQLGELARGGGFFG